MNNLAREQNRMTAYIAGSMIRRSANDSSSTVAGERVRTHVQAYDELDYRLMATFPASDATAQY